MVIATQKPLELDGTYSLPEAQRDRFTARTSIGYPTPQAELAMLDEHAGRDPLRDLHPVTDIETVRELIAAVGSIHISAPLRQYPVDVAAPTRTAPEAPLGAAPHATLPSGPPARGPAAPSARR